MKTFVSLFLLTFTSAQLFAQKDVDLDKFITELQKTSVDPDKLNLIWWIPNEFWEISMAQDDASEEEIEDIINSVGEYTIFVIVEGKLGSFGGTTYYTKDEISETIRLTDPFGDIYTPLSEENIDNNTTMFLQLMKPVFANILGSMGENMHFYLFLGLNQKDNRLLDPVNGGNFTLTVLDESYEWEVPVSSLLPPKFCPVDKKKMEGNWLYCPFHGVELLEK